MLLNQLELERDDHMATKKQVEDLQKLIDDRRVIGIKIMIIIF